MLEQKQIEFYAENGYLHLPGVLSAVEVAQLQSETDRLIEFASALQVPQPDYYYIRNPDTGQDILRRINFPGKRATACQALYGHPGILAITEGLLGRDFMPW